MNDDDILDEQLKDDRISLLLINGLFSFLVILGLSYASKMVLKDFLTFFGVGRWLFVLLTEIGSFLVLAMVSAFLAKRIKINAKKEVSLLRNLLKPLVITFILIQLFQFFYNYYHEELFPEYFSIQLEMYCNPTEELLISLNTILSIIGYLDYVIIVYFFWRK